MPCVYLRQHPSEYHGLENEKGRWGSGNLKEGENEAVPGEPGKMEYIQP
jgi:hypothetical protein